MAGGGSNTSTSYQIPGNATIESFINQTVPQLQEVQRQAPLYQFTEAKARDIAGLSPLQQYAGSLVPQIGAETPQSQFAQGLLGYPGGGGYAAPQTNFGAGSQGSMMPSGEGPLPGGMPPWMSGQGQFTNVNGVQTPIVNGVPLTGSGQGEPMEYGGGFPSGGQGAPNNQNALVQLAQLTSGPIGSSPATQAGMEAFRQNVLPTLQNELGAMGLGRSGVAGEQIQKAATTAALPLVQQEIQNRANAIPQYGNIATQLAGLGQQGVQNQTTAAGLGSSLGATQQQTAQASLDAPYQDWLRRQALSQSVSTLGGTPYVAPMGSTTTTPSSNFLGK